MICCWNVSVPAMTAQAEIEKSGFLHYAAAQPEPIVAVGALLARLAEKLDEYGQSFWEICPEKEDLAAELRGLHTVAELSLWLRGFLRRVENSLCPAGSPPPEPTVSRKRSLFCQDNYANPELCLKMVADYVALNEK